MRTTAIIALIAVTVTAAASPSLAEDGSQSDPLLLTKPAKFSSAPPPAANYSISHRDGTGSQVTLERSQRWDDRVEKAERSMHRPQNRKPVVDLANRTLSKFTVIDRDQFTEDRQVVGRPHNYELGFMFTRDVTLYFDKGLTFRLFSDDVSITLPDVSKKGFSLSVRY